MAINYPTSLDTLINKTDNVDDVMAVDINDLNDIAEALEAKVGVDSSAITTSHEYRLIEAGTIMLFGQNSAPTGWTRKINWQNNAMICYAATGNIASGGSVNPQSTHTHTGPSHTHTGPSHRHQWYIAQGAASHDETHNSGGNPVTIPLGNYKTDGARHIDIKTTDTQAIGHGYTSNSGTGATGAEGTGTTGANTAPYYQEVIAATKD